MTRICGFLLVLLTAFRVFGATDSKSGYIEDTRTESREDSASEPLILPKFVFENKPSLSSVIFDPKISEELRQEYRRRMGFTQAEQILSTYSHPNGTIDDGFVSIPRYTATQTSDQQTLFADYMYRRLIEYHIDQFSKTDARVKPVYEFKEKISKVDVAIAPGYSVVANYSFAGRNFETKFNNPWIESRLYCDLSTGGTGLLGSVETRLTFGKQATPTLHLETSYTMVEKAARFIIQKTLTPRMSTNLLYATPVGSLAERLILAGLGITF